MGLWSKLRDFLATILQTRAKQEFDLKLVESPEARALIAKCARVYAGRPDWVLADDVRTINFAQTVCSETARLVMLGTQLTVDGSKRAEWLQEQVDRIYFQLRQWIEYGCANGIVVLKPNGDGVDLLTPDVFDVTEEVNGEIRGAVFATGRWVGKEYYTRLEYHHFDKDGTYIVENKCFAGESEDDMSRSVPIEDTPWDTLSDHVELDGVEKPLFGVFKMPSAQNVEIMSPLGKPLFADALEELRDLDVAYTRNALEIEQSKKIVLLDSDRLVPTGRPTANTTDDFSDRRKAMDLPDYVKNVYGSGSDNFYQEINPQLRTDVRLAGINALLSQIGYKCGYSNGYFGYNQRAGVVTATQVEADDRRTIQFIKDVRDQVESCMDGLLYALDKFADLYDLAPVGKYEITYDFGDITYNREEDRMRWWGYVMAGKVPAWMYYNKFEGMSEEDAKAMVEEAQPQMDPMAMGAPIPEEE